MYRFKLLTILILLITAKTILFSQNTEDQKYQRSSLTMILLKDTTIEDIPLGTDTYTEAETMLYQKMYELPNKNAKQLAFMAEVEADTITIDNSSEAIRHLWNVYPFPDKYDKHEIACDSVIVIRSTKSAKELKKSTKAIEKQADVKDDTKKLDKVMSRFANKGQDIDLEQAAAISVLPKFSQNKLASLEKSRENAIGKLAKKGMPIKKYKKKLKKIDKNYGVPIQKIRNQAIEKYTGEKKNNDNAIFDALMKQQKDAKQLQPKIEQQIQELRIAHQVVKKWFASEDNEFWNMSTIQKRGLYNATELEAEIAKKDVRGMTKLADAGEELLNNSFITVTDIMLFDNKPIARLLENIGNTISDNAGAFGVIGSLVGSAASISFTIAAKSIEDGYTVLSKTFLYKLNWNEAVASEFYQNWGNDEAFEKMNFELTYIGVQYNKSRINAGIFNNVNDRKKDVVIRKAVTRNIDEAFATLQKENEVFKPMIPILGIEPVIAQIGMKEGLTGNEKFEVLEKRQDPETGKMKWKRVCTVSVDKANIWDNRYTAGEEPENIVLDKNGNPITVTAFKGGNNIAPGMMLKLIK